MYFNVKEPAYGALGNGVADDRPAIQAAITAANAVGGTVYFPPGTYLIGAGLTVNGAAGFLGSTGVTVTSTVNGIQQLSVGTGATGKFTIENMIFTLSGTGSKWALVSAGTDLVMINSRVTNTATLNANGNILNVAAGGDVTLVGVRFDIPVDNAIASSVLAPTTPIIAVNCEFNVSGTGVVAARPIKLLGGALLGCRFSSSMAGGGSISGYIEHQSGAGMLVAGCSFPNPVAGTISFAMASVQSNEIVEIGNTYGSAVPVFGGFTILDASNQWPATHTMAQLEQFVASDAALLTLSSFHGAWRLQRTTGAAQTLTVGFPATVGQLASLTVINGAGTPTITLFNVKGLAAIGPLTANTRSTIIMRSVAFGGGLVWVLVSSTLNWT
jgi:hypothetical protein